MIATSHINDCGFHLQRDPSDTVSVKDVLARAAAKGLLDGVDVGKSSKREKKRKKPKSALPKPSGNDNNSIQMKITEFLNRECKASSTTSRVETTPLSLKSVPPLGASAQIRKPSKPAASPSTPTTLVKNNIPSRLVERQTHLGRPRPEGKVIPLKSVEIVLPPVMYPLPCSGGARPQMAGSHFYCRFAGSKVNVPSYLTSSVSRRGDKPKGCTPSSLLRNPRPWL